VASAGVSEGRAQVVLIGPDQQDNLALGYLASAVAAAGHEVELVRFNTRADLDRCVAEVTGLEPDVVGFGIPFQTAIASYLELAATLRAHGCTAHVTCGGHVPTFCAHEILADSPHIDSVVRHDGEETLVEIVGRVVAGESLRGVLGLVHRDGDELIDEPSRPLVRDLDQLPTPRRRTPPLSVGGVPIAFLVTSRGCVGDCVYCSIRAFSRAAGGPHFRIRPVDHVADEMAGLYHREGVRIFFFQDDLFVLPSENKTFTRIHIFLGIESNSPRQLRYLGRTHTPEDNERALALCREHRILPSFNFMLFDPDCTLDDVTQTLDFAERHADMPWNVCRTEIYPGTKLKERLEAEGRLEGGWASYGYRMADDGAEAMFRIMRVAFHERAFIFDSLLNRLISLSFARQVHAAMFPGPRSEALDDAVGALLVEVHQDSVERMRRYRDFAATCPIDDVDRLQSYAVEEALAVNGADVLWHERFGKLWSHFNMRGAVMVAERAARAGWI